MPKCYTAKQGDCIASIAFEHGLLPDTIWNDAANKELRRKRKSPYLLMPGDTVVIPPVRPREEACQTEARHRFLRKAVPEHLRLVLRDEEGEPRAQMEYILTIDGIVRPGKTDGDGRLDVPIPPNARQGELRIGDGADAEIIPLELGGMDPIDQISGIQKRLNNLGFECGPADGELGPPTKDALRRFQSKHDLQVSGEPDEATRAKLEELHAS